MRAIINGKIITRDDVFEDKVILFDEKIVDIIPVEAFIEENVDQLIDASGKYISPGLIDLHIHGVGGSDTMDSNFEALEKISCELAKKGVTSFLPTTMTMSKEKIEKSLRNIDECKSKVSGAKILGCHMEGPFINEVFKGAQGDMDIIKPDMSIIKKHLDLIKIITLAPEMDEGNEFIKAVSEKGVIASIGHSNATFEESVKAIEDGVSYATHTFNAMRGLHHREPGVVGAIFAKDIFCELIADKVHVHQGFFETFVRINGLDKVILITDSMRAGCMKCGIYELGGHEVIVDENSARLKDGRLAGSILKLLDGVKNMLENTRYSIFQVINMASYNPACALGIDNVIGSLEKEKKADIIIFNEQFEVEETIISGETVFKR